MLAWLVRHGTRPGTAGERTVHTYAPLEGQSVRGAVWTTADQLDVVARGPGEFVARLAADRRPVTIVLPNLHAGADPGGLAELVLALDALDHVRLVVETRTGTAVHQQLAGSGAAVMDLDEPQWTDEARRTAWHAAHGQTAALRATGPQPAAVVELELDDPAVLCAADPWQVTAAFDADQEERGGLRDAWLRAGQSLCRDQDSAERALVLLTVLGDGADPRLRPELAQLAATAGWRLDWCRVRGDMAPPWPGPVFAMTTAGPSTKATPFEATLTEAELSGAIHMGAELSRAVTAEIVTAKRTKMPEGWPRSRSGGGQRSRSANARPSVATEEIVRASPDLLPNPARSP